jgi:hypothetical protein
MKTLARFILGTWLGAALLAGCASTSNGDCCGWADIQARTLLGSGGKNCGTIESHPLEPRSQQLRCVKLALAHQAPFMVSYHDTSKPGIETLEVAIFSAQGEKVLMKRTEDGGQPQVYVGACAQMSFAADGRIQHSNCSERPPRATG